MPFRTSSSERLSQDSSLFLQCSSLFLSRLHFSGADFCSLPLNFVRAPAILTSTGSPRASGSDAYSTTEMDPPHPTNSKRVSLESMKPTRKPHKTTYFFEPINNLTSDRAKTSSTASKPPTHTNPPTATRPKAPSAQPAVLDLSSDDRPQSSDDKRPLIQEILAHQSSDDSFDGIRWKASPTRVTKDRIPSSPLKNVTSPPAKTPRPLTVSESNLDKQASIAETNPVLSKYGTEFHNILSQTTPTLSRTHSDISSTESSNKRKLHQRSPSLVRAKSSGVDNLMRSKVKVPRLEVSAGSKNTLSSWMNKFETDSLPKHSTEDEQSNISDDPFSDDDSELLAALATQSLDNSTTNSINVSKNNSEAPATLERLNTAESGKNKENLHPKESDPISSQFSITEDSIIRDVPAVSLTAISAVKKADLDPISDSEDPFSEDDSELNEYLSVSQVPREQKTTYRGNETLTQVKRDAIHATTFQKSIQKFEQLQKTLEYQDKEVPEVQLAFERPDLKRYQIKGFQENFYGKDQSKRQLIMDVIDQTLKPQKLIIRGEYTELEFETNDIIHIIITNSQSPKLVDDTNNLLIWNPDTLISATAISQQLSCPRKVVLTNRLKFPGVSSLPLIIGNIIHGIFQACFINNRYSMEFMLELADQFIQEHLLNILSVGPEVEHVKENLVSQLPYLLKWFETYYRKPLSKRNEIDSGFRDKVSFSVSEVLAIEENIWSPMYGVKGMVDASLEVKMKNKEWTESSLMPMEIKTGREHITHQAQASLYALLYKDRYEMDINSFLLVYSKDGVTKKCDISKQDLKSLVNLRNRITKYFKSSTRELPPLLKRTTCDYCPVQEACMTINKLDEEGTAEESGIPPEMYNQITEHLNEKENYKEFYDYWDQLLTHEESISRKALKYLWVHTAKQREESQGMAIGDLVITKVEENPIEEKFYYTFARKNTGDDWIGSKIVKYDRIIISDELGHFNLGGGTILSISSSAIVVSAGRRVHTSDIKLSQSASTQDPSLKSQPGYSKPHNDQMFKSALRNQINYTPKVTYRIDKDEFFEGMGLARYNVLNLFTKNGDERRLRLIVDLEPPRFSPKSLMYRADPSKYNPDQIRAFDKVLTTKDYSLILGMPGTGKTTVIAQLIKYLVDNNKTVFLASYTHSAVDNILIKLKTFGVSFLRIGHLPRVHPEIQSYVPGSKIKNYQEFCDTYLTPPVVASTCLGIGDIAFNLRSSFDYCIIDEASQVSMPVSLGPLRFCEKFVLVGDHLQLPPLVQHPNPKVKAGLSKSLFKILAEAHPEGLVELTYQYRMCYEIMQLSNILVYQNRLKCGSDEVARQFLHVPNPGKLDSFLSQGHHNLDELWLHRVLKKENKVLFLNHDVLPGHERNIGERVDNLVEAELIRQLVEGLTICGVSEANIGVMSFNRAQLRLLHKKLWDKQDLEILTADQYQGRDKECIIISLVRSNKDKKAGDLVQEWRRINVAITRAKSKLIILGSKSTLSSADSIRTFIELLNDRKWIYDLLPKADTLYDFPAKGSQMVERKSEKGGRLLGNGVLRDIVNNMT